MALTDRNVTNGGPDERREQARVRARLGMPLHADDEPLTRRLTGLDDAVVRPRGGDEWFGKATDRLVMMGVHLGRSAYGHMAAATLGDGDRVAAEPAGCRGVADVADHIGQVLDEVAAERHVEELESSADAEDRHPQAEHGPGEADFGRVVGGTAHARPRVGLFAVEPRVDIGTSRQNQPGQGTDKFVATVGVRRDEERTAAGLPDHRDQVVGRQDGTLLPIAPSGESGVRGDTDERSHVLPPIHSASEPGKSPGRGTLR